MARQNKNAWQVANKNIGFMGQGLPNPSNPQNQIFAYIPNFDITAFLPLGDLFQANYYDWGFRGISVRTNALLENTASTGTVTYDSEGVTISTNSANSGEASISIKGWEDGGENALFDRMSAVILAASWDGYDSTSALGVGEFTFGQFDATSGILTNSSTTEGWWVYSTTTGGTTTEYFCTSDGTSVTATDITSSGGPNFAEDRVMLVEFVQGQEGIDSISISRGISQGEPMATHTTNLPSGGTTSPNWPRFTATVKNGASDTTARAIVFRDLQIRSA